MESDISELIETAAPTDNEEEEEDIIPVESVDEEERFEDGYGDGERIVDQWQSDWYRYRYNNKNWLHTEKDVVEAIETAAPTNN